MPLNTSRTLNITRLLIFNSNIDTLKVGWNAGNLFSNHLAFAPMKRISQQFHCCSESHVESGEGDERRQDGLQICSSLQIQERSWRFAVTLIAWGLNFVVSLLEIAREDFASRTKMQEKSNFIRVSSSWNFSRTFKTFNSIEKSYRVCWNGKEWNDILSSI